MCELKWDDIYVDASGRQLTYTFIGGKSYAVFAADRSMNSMENLFYGLTRLKKIHNGKIYLNNIDINYIDEDIYLKHIITPIDKMVLPGRKKKVIKHLRYISNDFEKIRENHLDIEECIGLIKKMLDEFECDVQILENRICDLDIKDKVVIKLVESLVLDSKFLIIHEFEEEYLQNIIKYLNLLKTKYHRCILVFTYSEHILPYFDEIVSI